MTEPSLRDLVPTWAVALTAVLMLVTLAYSLFVSATVLLWALAWGAVVGAGVLVLAVSLLYRLTVAAERIAENA